MVARGSSAASSQLAALPRSPWLQPAYSCISSFRAAGRHARPSSDGPSSMVAYAEQSRVRNGQAVVSSIAEALVTNGCCSRKTGECESTEGNLLAAVQYKADPSGKNQVGSGIGKEDGEVIRRPSQMRRTITRSKAAAARKICQPGCMSSTCVVGQITGSYGSEVACGG